MLGSMENPSPSSLRSPGYEVRIELPGWALFGAQLSVAEGDPTDPMALGSLREQAARVVREALQLETLAQDPRVAALRKLFRQVGCDPTRYRPSAEALLRRLLKGGELPAIHPLVDLNNCLSAELAAPCCVMAEGTFTPPLVLRRGRAEDAYDSLRGPFNPQDKPLLTDAQGPLDTPITGNERVKVRRDTVSATLVAYLPAAVMEPEAAHGALLSLLAQAPVARLDAAWAVRQADAGDAKR
jgi:DNA/RNA-binding domain of Phe-tRNA-synthetase-like protein